MLKSHILKNSERTCDSKNTIWSLGNERYGLFFSAPMTGLSNSADYKRNKDQAIDIIRHIQNKHGITEIFYAGFEIESADKFDAPENAMATDLDAIASSSAFILYYPEPMASSALIELGFALGIKKPIIIITKNRKTLPYLIKNADHLSCTEKFPFIDIIEFTDKKDLFDKIDSSISNILK